MTRPRRCPALLVAAAASGQGKTTITAALARHHRNRGRRVRVFKTGPDFLDPLILARASGAAAHSLDLWMGGEDHCRHLIYEAAGDADLILIEGVMGLHDGAPSSADLAARFGVPVLAVIDASAMAQTFGAVALGLARYRTDVTFAGVIANRVAGARHADMLANSLRGDIRYLGHLERDTAATLPERHLGLVSADEVDDLDARLDAAAAAIAAQPVAALPAPVAFAAPTGPHTPLRELDGVRIGVARDAAFAFLYPANLELLAAMGASLEFFSPLGDTVLPDVDALWLPGGYPELHAEPLASNHAMRAAIRAHHRAGRPTVAECGGMMYLFESLRDRDGNERPMAGVLPGRTVMQARLANLGLQAVALPEGQLRGHTFHYSTCECSLAPATTSADANGGRGEAVYRDARLTASYLHFYFPSNPEAVARLFLP